MGSLPRRWRRPRNSNSGSIQRVIVSSSVPLKGAPSVTAGTLTSCSRLSPRRFTE